ncbi:hypothetical protein SLS62_005525 [Diatrype stigma]|uniref:G-protein coupled receptors family 2 profile 2 domain-containing protein n=1 Tax=Diatrype stigma TaxID=117547 RepID=A0AAN9USL5_9PEZI
MNETTHNIAIPKADKAFSEKEMKAIIVIERIGASLSVAGCLLVFIAYLLSKRLRSVPNTFIVFASVANLGASIACLIGDSGMSAQHGNLCQAQAFMFELQRNQLRNLSLSNPSHDTTAGQRDSEEKEMSTPRAAMGSVNTEVIQVTTTTTHNTPLSTTTAGASSASTRIDWFEGPPDDREYGRDDMSRSSSSPINTPYLMVTRITADPTAQSALPENRRPSLPARVRRGFWQWQARLGRMDPVKLAYLRTSFVFAISVLVTWTPSSINRVHDVMRGAEVGSGSGSRNPPSFGLNLASAVVLPLQGVWNAVIFFSTSSTALREEFRARADAFRGLPRGHQAANAALRERERTLELERRCGGGRRRNFNGTHNKNHHADRSISDFSGSSTRGELDTSADVGDSGNGGGTNNTIGKARDGSVASSELRNSSVGSPMLGNANNTATSSTMRVIKGGSLSSL